MPWAACCKASSGKENKFLKYGCNFLPVYLSTLTSPLTQEKDHFSLALSWVPQRHHHPIINLGRNEFSG